MTADDEIIRALRAEAVALADRLERVRRALNVLEGGGRVSSAASPSIPAQIRAYLADGRIARASEIAAATQLNAHRVGIACVTMANRGQLTRVKIGHYRLKASTDE